MGYFSELQKNKSTFKKACGVRAKKNIRPHAIFLQKNLVGKKKSRNFALGFGNERREAAKKVLK
ncbi:MAG: hypothetical protein K2K75_14705 [Muribaculaceae bacterium]|nr:hypothetical protein [Muribaculaceae bacterium]